MSGGNRKNRLTRFDSCFIGGAAVYLRRPASSNAGIARDRTAVQCFEHDAVRLDSKFFCDNFAHHRKYAGALIQYGRGNNDFAVRINFYENRSFATTGAPFSESQTAAGVLWFGLFVA